LANDKATIAIDMELKLAFLLTKDHHHKEFKDALELGVLTIIDEVDPEKASELRIRILEQKLEEERQNLANYKLAKQMRKPESKKQKNVDLGLEKVRLEKFEPRKDTLAYQVKNGKIDWKTISDLFMFNSTNEAREWTLNKLQEAELLG
jgi:hypothetical protein